MWCVQKGEMCLLHYLQRFEETLLFQDQDQAKEKVKTKTNTKTRPTPEPRLKPK